MKCAACGTENALGTQYCAGCGVKLEITDAEAHMEAVASVRRDTWQDAFRAMNRALFFFLLVFIGALLFRAYANREVAADFSADAPLPEPPVLRLDPACVHQPRLAIPALGVTDALLPDKDGSGKPFTAEEVTANLASNARGWLYADLVLQTGDRVKGVLLSHTKSEYRIIRDTDWGPPIKPRVVKKSDLLRIKVLPDAAKAIPFPPRTTP